MGIRNHKMKILVCISNVPDTTSKISFTADNSRFEDASVQYIINPYDEIALTRAVEIAGQTGGSVTAIHVGEANTEPILRKTLASGATDAVRIDAAPRDAWFVANQIAAYCKDHAFDLILTGKESIDYNGAQIPAMLGELLAIPSVSISKKITIEGQSAIVDREIEGGKEVLSIPLPAVIGTSEGVAVPQIPNIRNIIAARTKPLLVAPAIEVPVLEKIERFELPPTRGAVTLLPADQPEELVKLLHTEAKVI